jgi:hypothetical protein
MHCKYCGKKNNDEARFCKFCGKKLETKEATEKDAIDLRPFPKKPAQEKIEKEFPKSRKFSFWKTFVYIFLVLLVLLVIFFGLIGSCTEGFGDAFFGVVILSFILAIILTFFIKWWKDYRATGKLILEEATPETESFDVKPGIRGWLILVAIGLIISSLFCLYYLFTIYLPIFMNGTWELLTNSNSAYYIPSIGGVVIFEVIIQFLFLVASLYLLFLFFQKNRRFPQLYIIYLVSIVFFGIIDYAIILSIPSIASEVEDNSDLGRAIISALIWIPYITKSKLVKATFVK